MCLISLQDGSVLAHLEHEQRENCIVNPNIINGEDSDRQKFPFLFYLSIQWLWREKSACMK